MEGSRARCHDGKDRRVGTGGSGEHGDRGDQQTGEEAAEPVSQVIGEREEPQSRAKLLAKPPLREELAELCLFPIRVEASTLGSRSVALGRCGSLSTRSNGRSWWRLTRMSTRRANEAQYSTRIRRVRLPTRRPMARRFLMLVLPWA
ncbi:hypothetical protein GCM10009734_95270 [Nonomuraea bangladeshensis]